MTSGLRRDAFGLGLRVPHYDHVLERRPHVDFFELLTDNYLREDARARAYARSVAAAYPVVLHGVGLNLLGPEPLDERYLDAVARLADEVDAVFVTDHVCWTRSKARNHHDLLPVPFTTSTLEYGAERAAYAASRIGRPFGLENLSSYVAFASSTMTEWAFYSRLVAEAGCYFLLDVNNVFVSGKNLGFDPEAYLGAIDFSRVLALHLAGHDTPRDGVIVDTHDRAVCDEVWALYASIVGRYGRRPTLIERDASIPPFDVLLAELERARHLSP